MKIFKHQLGHIIFLIGLIVCMYLLVGRDPAFLKGELYGVTTTYWLILGLLSAILHQVYVLIWWRVELYYQGITNLIGENGFTLFKIGFLLLFLFRPVSIILVSISNSRTLILSTALAWLFSTLLFFPSAYLFYSVKKYFGMDRAFGIDHFRPEKFKKEPLVKKGIFKYGSNGMYKFGFLILYIPGLLLQSKAGLAVALFHHLYIWVHYYFTELPDMKVIYGTEVS